MNFPFIILVVLFIQVTGFVYSNAENTVRVEVSVRDSYTEIQLESARVSIVRNNQVIDYAYTDSDGIAILNYTITSVDNVLPIPDSFVLSENYPNPFYDHTRVNIDIPETQSVRAEVFNTLGQRIITRDLSLQPGMHALTLAMSSLPTGVYFLVVHGSETQTVKLTKMGRSISQFTPMLSVERAPGGGSGILKQADGNLVTIRVEKDRYESKGIQKYISDDTAMTMGLDRLNEVVFTVIDDEEQIRERELHITASFVNLFVDTPDTMILKSGVYNVSSPLGDFSSPINETVEITSSDTTILLEVTTIPTVLSRVSSYNPANELLFFSEHIEGSRSYFFGTNNPDTIYVYYFVFQSAEGDEITIILHEDLYPIHWLFDGYTISVRRTSNEEFDPHAAFHHLLHADGEDTTTLNIYPHDLYQVIDELEQRNNSNLNRVREFLAQETDNFQELSMWAKQSGEKQSDYLLAAISFAVAHAGLRMIEASEENSFGSFKEIALSAAQNNLLAAPFLNHWIEQILNHIILNIYGHPVGDPEAPIVDVFLCRGQSSVVNICHWAYISTGGPVSPCLAICATSISCFSDICMPMQMSSDRVIDLRNNF